MQTEGRRALGAQSARVDRAVRVPLDVYDAPVAVVDQGRATHGAVRAHAHRPLHALVREARADVSRHGAYRMLDLDPDVVLDLGPQAVSLRDLEEHAPPLSRTKDIYSIFEFYPYPLRRKTRAQIGRASCRE